MGAIYSHGSVMPRFWISIFSATCHCSLFVYCLLLHWLSRERIHTSIGMYASVSYTETTAPSS